jgi:hypothetical protein
VLPRSDWRRWLRDVLEEVVTPRIIRSCPNSSQETKGKAASQHCEPIARQAKKSSTCVGSERNTWPSATLSSTKRKA